MRKPHDVIYLTQDSSNLEQEIYWCQDKIDEADIKYIRADLAPQYRELSDEEIEELREYHGINDWLYETSVTDFARAILKKASEK